MYRTASLYLGLALVLAGCVQATDQKSMGDSSQRRVKLATVDELSTGNVDLPRFPSLSPDGSQIVFSWRGDLWKVSSKGGLAIRLTRHDGDDLRSAWSPDGKRIAFESNRNGYRNIHVMDVDGTDVRMVTDIDRTCVLTDYTLNADGEEIVTFDGYLEGDNYDSPRPYYCSIDGGGLIRVHHAFGSHPTLSPDGSAIAFIRGNSRATRRHYRGPNDRDVWLLDTNKDTFKQLTAWEGNDDQVRWANANTLLYISDRELDCMNLYRRAVDRSEGRAERLTSFDDTDIFSYDVSANGSTVVANAWDTLYVIDLHASKPRPSAINIFANEDDDDNYQLKSINREVTEAALSPDGKVMAYVAYGEVYVRNLEDKSPTRRVTEDHARAKHIAWSPDGLKLYFASDVDNTDSIYAATVELTRGEVKEEFDKAINPPKEEPEGEEKGEAEEDEAKEKEAETNNGVEVEGDTKNETVQEKVDEEKDGKDEKKKEEEEEEELPKELQPDRWHDAMKFKIEPVLVEEGNDRNPVLSPDGKYLAYRHGRGDLMLLELETGEKTTVYKGWDTGIHWTWSPNSKHIAYAVNDLDFNSDIWIVSTDGSEPAVNVTRHPDNDYNPNWSADGKILSFLSERVDEEYDVWSVYLDKDLEALTAKELEEYYDEAAKAAKKRKPLEVKKPKQEEKEEDADEEGEGNDAVDSEEEDAGDDSADEVEDDEADEEEAEEEEKKLDLDDAYLRLRRITRFEGSESGLVMTPGGDRLIFNGTHGERALYSVKWDGSDRKKLTSSSSVQQVSLTGDKVVIVKGNQAATVKPAGGGLKTIGISDKIRIDLQEQASQKFKEAARTIGEQFYHPTMKGLDWEGISEKYHRLAKQTRTASEFAEVGMRLLGELNGSHLGIYPRDGFSSSNSQSMGRLGVNAKRVPEGFEVLRVIPHSPADKGSMKLEVGDVITAIELEPIDTKDTLETMLRGLSGKETLITIRRTMKDGEVKDLNILLTPISYRALNQLKYKDFRRTNAKLVDEWSNGRLGYIHIQGMNQSSLDVFERDLYAAAHGKDGLIIDVRNNGGGWTADRLLSSIMVEEHAYTVPRGADWNETGHYPQDRLFIQRYTQPMNMLCNEKSFSNAEIVSHAFKTLKRGKLVGQQTYGGVISTGGTSLIDGTFLRLPFRGWFVKGGMDMENNGAIPDIIVEQTPEAEAANRDEQLKAAVDDLLKRID